MLTFFADVVQDLDLHISFTSHYAPHRRSEFVIIFTTLRKEKSLCSKSKRKFGLKKSEEDVYLMAA